MRKPPGVIMWRNGALETTSLIPDRISVSSVMAKLRRIVAPGPRGSSLSSILEGPSNRLIVMSLPLCRVVENDADCMTVSRPDAADAVPQVYAIRAALTLHGPVVNCENNAISLTERHDHRPALHARALFRHDELSTGEVRAGVGQQNSQLEREDMLAVEVLVQAVVVVDSILKQKRRRPHLTGIVATVDEVGVLFRIARIDSHRFIPAIGDRDQMRIDRCPEFAQKIGKRIAEILVLPAPEAMPPHDDATAKDVVIGVKTGDASALLRGKKLFHHGVALLVQVSPDPLPVERINALDCWFHATLQLANSLDPNHACASFSRSTRFRSTPQR